MRMALLTTGALFPAQAGVIPYFSKSFAISYAVPRASGGDPYLHGKQIEKTDCSPRKRG